MLKAVWFLEKIKSYIFLVTVIVGKTWEKPYLLQNDYISSSSGIYINVIDPSSCSSDGL